MEFACCTRLEYYRSIHVRTLSTPRLSSVQVEHFKREGYVIYRDRFLLQLNFRRLKITSKQAGRLRRRCAGEHGCAHFTDHKLSMAFF